MPPRKTIQDETKQNGVIQDEGGFFRFCGGWGGGGGLHKAMIDKEMFLLAGG